jgi:hypothetical protein
MAEEPLQAAESNHRERPRGVDRRSQDEHQSLGAGHRTLAGLQALEGRRAEFGSDAWDGAGHPVRRAEDEGCSRNHQRRDHHLGVRDQRLAVPSG